MLRHVHHAHIRRLDRGTVSRKTNVSPMQHRVLKSPASPVPGRNRSALDPEVLLHLATICGSVSLSVVSISIVGIAPAARH
jgi:hypothetical protein